MSAYSRVVAQRDEMEEENDKLTREVRSLKAERDALLAALKRLNTKTLTRPPALYSDIAPPHYSFNEDDAQAIREAIAKAGGAK